jgi:signal transduction histidine kinase
MQFPSFSGANCLVVVSIWTELRRVAQVPCFQRNISTRSESLLLVLLVLRTISRPLQKITLAAVQVTEGGYGTQIDLRKSNDEIGLLANSFNEMSSKMASDIIELKRLNEQLIRTEKLAAMGTLAAGVAHEVNNPLASISSLIQMIRNQNGIDADTRDKLNLVSEQIKRITQVTRDMTDFARTRPAAKTFLNINEVIETSLRLASFDSAFRKLDVRVDLNGISTEVYADADQLQQVFLNLFLNARDAMPDGGSLGVSSEQNNDEVVFRISDSGVGISEATANLIFDPFFTTKSAGKGTGLGLAVCYGIIMAHGGTIRAEPNSPTGTTFVVSLPLQK